MFTQYNHRTTNYSIESIKSDLKMNTHWRVKPRPKSSIPRATQMNYWCKRLWATDLPVYVFEISDFWFNHTKVLSKYTYIIEYFKFWWANGNSHQVENSFALIPLSHRYIYTICFTSFVIQWIFDMKIRYFNILQKNLPFNQTII